MVSTKKNKTSWVFPKEAVGFPVDKDQILIGKHVIVAWQDQVYTWEIGVVDQCKEGIISVSHMVSRNKNKTSWVFPKEAVGFPVDKDQILM